MISRFLLSAATIATASPVHAQAAFDLAGPDLAVTVSRDGAALPIARVPQLEPGDGVTVAAVLPPDQEARYLLVAAFLRGATDPPPRGWFARAETWKGKTLALTVPRGAAQLVLFLVPKTGGDFPAVVRAVRGQPGVFARAAQDLNHAAADRARLDAFLRVVQRGPGLRAPDAIPPTLTRSLGLRIDTQCLDRRPELQAACLSRGSDPVVLQDRARDGLTETLTGAPVDLAIQLSNTPAGGYGFYSPYIGVLRDVARLFGAFRSAQFQYIPTLARMRDDRIGTLLNAAPSFRSPRSVLVVPMPPVEPSSPPVLATPEPRRALCATRRDLLLPVMATPALFATAHLHDLSLAAPGLSLPLRADLERGGLALAGEPALPDRVAGEVEAVVRGRWGFASFEGPRVRLQGPRGREWRAAGEEEATLVVGRDNRLELRGGAASCVAGVELEEPRGARPVGWTTPGDDRLSLDVPLARVRPGPVTLLVRHHGEDAPARLTLRALAEGSRVDALRLHAGDAGATLSGARLDLVQAVTAEGVTFRPGELTRDGQADRLALRADDAGATGVLVAGEEGSARVSLSDGRRLSVKYAVAPPRPAVALIGRSIARPTSPSPVRIALTGEGAVPQDARLTFSFRAERGRLSPADAVEVAAEGGTATLRAGEGLTMQDAQVAVASFEPGKLLGSNARGALRFRLTRDGVSGDWVPLGTLVRLPVITAVRCAPARSCTIQGERLFLLSAVAGDARFGSATDVPDGFTGDSLSVPAASSDRMLHLRLRDGPDIVATVPRG